MDMIFGLHNWPQSPEGTFLWRSGDVMAAVGWIDITITGKGSHGAKRMAVSASAPQLK